jgi:hypothetical protein
MLLILPLCHLTRNIRSKQAKDGDGTEETILPRE